MQEEAESIGISHKIAEGPSYNGLRGYAEVFRLDVLRFFGGIQDDESKATCIRNITWWKQRYEDAEHTHRDRIIGEET